MRRNTYPPLAKVLADHAYAARRLKHLHRPNTYIRCRLTVASNPPWEPGTFIYGIYVVNVDEVRAARRERRPPSDHIVQDFLVVPRQEGKRAALFSGGRGRRGMDAFCRRFAGPKGNGYGCRLNGEWWMCGDHYPKVLPHEGRFRAAMNDALKEARRAAAG